jgi:uncharacterized LabA/DUF88 family protein
VKRIAVMIDGGHVQFLAKKAGKTCDASFIEKLGLSCATTTDEIWRILYYDCARYEGAATLPVSGAKHRFTGGDQVLRDLAQKNLIAVRRGVLKFRGWIPKKIPIAGTTPLTDGDFKPNFEQKGVDMRIGLDMANYSANRAVELIALVTNDTDCIPAMKYARRAGLQVALVCLPGCPPAPELIEHADFLRPIQWP